VRSPGVEAPAPVATVDRGGFVSFIESFALAAHRSETGSGDVARVVTTAACACRRSNPRPAAVRARSADSSTGLAILVDPTSSAAGAQFSLAPRRFRDLDGRTVGLLNSTKYNSDHLLDGIADLLVERYSAVGT
jgi:hypothetical protein